MCIISIVKLKACYCERRLQMAVCSPVGKTEDMIRSDGNCFTINDDSAGPPASSLVLFAASPMLYCISPSSNWKTLNQQVMQVNR